MYSDSLGAIQSALEGLLRDDLVSAETAVERGRNKRVFRTTTQGQASFYEWMTLVPDDVSASEREQVVRLFFLGQLEREDRVQVLQKIVEGLEKKTETLTDVLSDTQSMEIAAELVDIARFQVATIEMALLEVRTQTEFCQKLLKESSRV